MNEEKRIGDALRDLPRQSASDRFTENVLDRLRQPQETHRIQWMRIAASIVGGLVLLGAVESVQWWREARDREALRAEHQQIVEELRSIKKVTDAATPVVYVGGNDDVDFVLDLSDPAAREDPQHTKNDHQLPPDFDGVI